MNFAGCGMLFGKTGRNNVDMEKLKVTNNFLLVVIKPYQNGEFELDYFFVLFYFFLVFKNICNK